MKALTRVGVYPTRQPKLKELLLEFDFEHFNTVTLARGSTPADVAAALRVLADAVEDQAKRRLVATLPQTREDEALRAGHRELWRVDLPDGTYTQLPGDPPGPAELRRVQDGIVYDVQPRTGRLIPASRPRMLPGCVTAAIRTDGVDSVDGRKQ